MKHLKLEKELVMNKYARYFAIFLSIGVAIYVAVLLIRDVPVVYSNAINYSGNDSIFAYGLTAFVSFAGISSIAIPYLLFRSAKIYWLLPFIAHLLFVIPSYPVYGLTIYLFVWWSTMTFNRVYRFKS